MQILHICEVCGVEEILTPEAAYEAGWDYPPRMGAFGVISPRICPHCLVNQTVWWAVAMEGYKADMLTPKQQLTNPWRTGQCRGAPAQQRSVTVGRGARPVPH
jgi:hypothetical protein